MIIFPTLPSTLTRSSKMKEAVIESALDSKIHGISNLVRVDSKLLKLIWLICFTSCAVYCFYLISSTLMLFLSYKVIPVISLKYETPAPFPAVDFCNLDAYDGNTARIYLERILAEEKIEANKFSSSRDYVNTASRTFKAKLENLALENKFSLYGNGFFLEQMLITCKFQNEPCDLNDFFYYHDYNYGSCYRFNGIYVNSAGASNKSILNKERFVQKAGWENGLQLELYIGNPKQQQQFNFKGGVRIIVHSRTSETFPDDEGIDVSAGQQTNVAILKQSIKRLEEPYSKCFNSNSLNWNQNNVLKFMKDYYQTEEYSQDYCFKVCQQLFILSKCCCYDLKFPLKFNPNDEYRQCSTSQDINCVVRAEEKFIKNNAATDCFNKCGVECDTVIYDLVTSFANYPTNWYANYLLNNSRFLNLVVNNTANSTMPQPTIESLQQTILMVNVFYDELFYTNTDEEPRLSFENFIALVGGYLGLFLGMSLLSLIEIFEIIFLIVYHYILKKYKKYKLKKIEKNSKKN